MSTATTASCSARVASRMLRAVARGNLSKVSALLANHGSGLLRVHAIDGCTPLLVACRCGHGAVVDYLLSKGCSVTDTDMDSKRQGCAVHYAAWGGHVDLLLRLVDEHNGQLSQLDVVGNTPLLYAIYGGHKVVIEALLARGRSLYERNNKNHTAILQAACGGHLEIVDWLLQRGFSIQETDNDGNTALLFAAWGGHRELMTYLLANGSDLGEKNHNGHSVFLSAANGGRVAVVEWLLEQGFSIDETNNNGDTALLLAAYGGHHALVERLVEIGASLDDTNGCGFTPLLSAANGGQLEMARWLLKNGSSLDEADHDGYTSLILASCGGSIELVSFFLEQGASLQERNNNGDTALLLAAYCGHRQLVAWLLANGSTVLERNNTGMDVVISAANGGHLPVMKLLLEKVELPLGLEITDEGGYTPLLLAAQRGHLSVVKYLAAMGANMEARTTRHDNEAINLAIDSPDVQAYLRTVAGWRPLQIACEARMPDRVHAMLRAGACPVTNYMQGPSPIVACQVTQDYRGALPPHRALCDLMRLATRPWYPSTHCLYGPEHRSTVVLALMLKRRLEIDTDIPRLPNEVWCHIITFFSRTVTQSEEVARDTFALRSTASEQIERITWRRFHLNSEAEHDDGPFALEDDATFNLTTTSGAGVNDDHHTMATGDESEAEPEEEEDEAALSSDMDTSIEASGEEESQELVAANSVMHSRQIEAQTDRVTPVMPIDEAYEEEGTEDKQQGHSGAAGAAGTEILPAFARSLV